jgi:hypothetical protein
MRARSFADDAGKRASSATANILSVRIAHLEPDVVWESINRIRMSSVWLVSIAGPFVFPTGWEVAGARNVTGEGSVVFIGMHRTSMGPTADG